MGVYLNGTSAYGLFQEDYSMTYYIDKTKILSELIPMKGLKYVAITRPRRFGKTVMANMIASYFGKGVDSHKEFDSLAVSKYPWYKKHLNQHNVIHITFNKAPANCHSYDQYISRFEKGLLTDLQKTYPEAEIEKDDALWDALTKVYEYCGGEKFIFVLDECDYIYHQNFADDREKAQFTKFLSNLLKDNAYVELAYMTGI